MGYSRRHMFLDKNIKLSNCRLHVIGNNYGIFSHVKNFRLNALLYIL